MKLQNKSTSKVRHSRGTEDFIVSMWTFERDYEDSNTFNPGKHWKQKFLLSGWYRSGATVSPSLLLQQYDNITLNSKLSSTLAETVEGTSPAQKIPGPRLWPDVLAYKPGIWMQFCQQQSCTNCRLLLNCPRPLVLCLAIWSLLLVEVWLNSDFVWLIYFSYKSLPSRWDFSTPLYFTFPTR